MYSPSGQASGKSVRVYIAGRLKQSVDQSIGDASPFPGADKSVAKIDKKYGGSE